MDTTIEALTEELVCEFHDASATLVMRVVCDCVEEFPDDGSWFIAQASRARLGQLSGQGR